MTHPAEEKLAAIAAGLDGVPDGPWVWGSGYSEQYMLDAHGKIILDDGSSDGAYAQTLDPKSPLGVHLPRCDPATMREMVELKAERDAALAECERLKLQITAGVNYDSNI